jgi:hypothetical protein
MASRRIIFSLKKNKQLIEAAQIRANQRRIEAQINKIRANKPQINIGANQPRINIRANQQPIRAANHKISIKKPPEPIIKENRKIDPVIKENKIDPVIKQLTIISETTEITFKKVLENIKTLDKKIIPEELFKNLSFYKIIDDVGYPLVGFILQQLEREPNKDFKNYIDLLKKIGFRNIRNEMQNMKNHKTNIIKLHRAILRLRTPHNKTDIDEIIKIHKKYKYENIIKNINVFLNNPQNILDTLSYFVVVIGIKIICSIIILSIPGLSLLSMIENLTRIDSDIDETTTKPIEDETLSESDNHTISYSANSVTSNAANTRKDELIGKNSELLYTFADKKYITFIRKLPGLILLYIELNKAIDEVEPDSNVELNKLLKQLDLSDDGQITAHFQEMRDSLEPCAFSTAFIEGIDPLIKFLKNQNLSEINDVDLSYYAIDRPIKIPINPEGVDQKGNINITKLLNLINFYATQFPENYMENKMPKTYSRLTHKTRATNITSKAINAVNKSLKPQFSNNTLTSFVVK